MILVTMAHKGEAQETLRSFNMTSHPQDIKGLYTCDKFNLLITGEGLEDALFSVTNALSSIKVTKVINIGICGKLDSQIELEVDEIVSVRSSYKETDNKMNFKSFQMDQCDLCESYLDVVSSNRRVVDVDYKNHLSVFAELVDRELWSIAFSAKKLNISMSAYKIVSDDSSSPEICSYVKEHTENFSKVICEFLKKKLSNQSIIVRALSQKEKIEEESILLKDKRFYFSVSQKNHYINYLLKVAIKGESEKDVISRINIDDICEKFQRPKLRSSALLVILEEIINPFKVSLKNKLKSSLEVFESSNIKVHTDASFEKDELNLSINIASDIDLTKARVALKNFDYNEYKSLLNGEIDV